MGLLQCKPLSTLNSDIFVSYSSSPVIQTIKYDVFYCRFSFFADHKFCNFFFLLVDNQTCPQDDGGAPRTPSPSSMTADSKPESEALDSRGGVTDGDDEKNAQRHQLPAEAARPLSKTGDNLKPFLTFFVLYYKTHGIQTHVKSAE